MLFKHISKRRACPRCQSVEVFRVKRSGMALKFLCNVTNLRPHWCPNCDTFFLAPRQEKTTSAHDGVELSSKQPASEPSQPRSEPLPH
jgi:hypothetical protein